jgi:hypothetical protein
MLHFGLSLNILISKNQCNFFFFFLASDYFFYPAPFWAYICTCINKNSELYKTRPSINLGINTFENEVQYIKIMEHGLILHSLDISI